MSAIGILRSFAEARSADHEPIPARLTYGTIREVLRVIEDWERSAELACESPPPGCECPGCSLARERFGG